MWHPLFLCKLLAECFLTVGFVFPNHSFVGNSSNCKGIWFYEKFIRISDWNNKSNMEDYDICTFKCPNTSDEDCRC